MLEGILAGLTTALTLQNLVMVVAGCLIGTLIGMLPGLGPMSIIAIMIPVAIKIGDPSAALILLAGVYYGAIFGGSTSSILINAPGVAGTVATAFDGYPLARQGKAGKALTIAAIASFAGGTVGAILLMGFAPGLATVALLFHSAEYFALMVVGLAAIAAFAGSGQVAKALMMTILGVMLATVGESALFNAPRFTMGIQDLQSGISFITLAMALFALPEALYLVLDPSRSNKGQAGGDRITNLRITRSEAKEIAPVIGRQSFQGFLIGVMPGAGATIASFLGYAVERNIAKGEDQEKFGKGSVKGLAAPENGEQRCLHGVIRTTPDIGDPGFRHYGHPARRPDRAERFPRAKADGRQPVDILGRHHLHVYWQRGFADSESSANPLYRQTASDPQELPDPVHTVFHNDGQLYRSKQCDRTAVADRHGHRGDDHAAGRVSTCSDADRVHPGTASRRQFRQGNEPERRCELHVGAADDGGVARLRSRSRPAAVHPAAPVSQEAG